MAPAIPETMRAMILEEQPGRLSLAQVPVPRPGEAEVLVMVEACGVCRTDLHIVDGDLEAPALPLVPGHEVVGTVVAKGDGVDWPGIGDRVGIPWMAASCGACRHCRSGRENLCHDARFTGFHQPGGYAEYCVVRADYALPIPDGYDPVSAAPLLCAGLIGYRSYAACPAEAERIGLYGFGAAAHIVVQVAAALGKKVFAFTRDGDRMKQEFALGLGAVWAGGSSSLPPEPLDAAIIFAPAGELVPRALEAVDRGGRVVCAGIHMSDIPSFPYSSLWWEKSIASVANLTRKDGEEFMEIASRIEIRTETQAMRLEAANEALEAMKKGRLKGAAVLVP